jgi:hypothetical protein
MNDCANYLWRVVPNVFLTNGYGERFYIAVADLIGGLGVLRSASVDFKFNFF